MARKGGSESKMMLQCQLTLQMWSRWGWGPSLPSPCKQPQPSFLTYLKPPFLLPNPGAPPPTPPTALVGCQCTCAHWVQGSLYLSVLYTRLLGSPVSLILQLGKVSIGKTCLAKVMGKKKWQRRVLNPDLSDAKDHFGLLLRRNVKVQVEVGLFAPSGASPPAPLIDCRKLYSSYASSWFHVHSSIWDTF